MVALAPALHQVRAHLPEAIMAGGNLFVAKMQNVLSMRPRTMNEAIEMVATRLDPTPSWDSLMASLPTASRPIFRAASVHSGVHFRSCYTLQRLDLALTIVEHQKAASSESTQCTLGEKGVELLPWSVAMVNFHRLALHDALHWDGRAGREGGAMQAAICELSEVVVSQYELHKESIYEVLEAASTLVHQEPLSTEALREAVKQEVAWRQTESKAIEARITALERGEESNQEEGEEAESLRSQLMSNVMESQVLLQLERKAKHTEAKFAQNESRDIAERIERLQPSRREEHLAAPVSPSFNELTPPPNDGACVEPRVALPRLCLEEAHCCLIPVRSEAMKKLCGDMTVSGILVRGASSGDSMAGEELDTLDLDDWSGEEGCAWDYRERDGERKVGWGGASKEREKDTPAIMQPVLQEDAACAQGGGGVSDVPPPGWAHRCNGDRVQPLQLGLGLGDRVQPLESIEYKDPPPPSSESSVVEIVMPWAASAPEPEEEAKWTTTTTASDAARLVVVRPKATASQVLQANPGGGQKIGLTQLGKARLARYA